MFETVGRIKQKLKVESEWSIDANDNNVSRILKVFKDAQVSQLPVVKDGKPIGILDLFEYLNNSKEKTISEVMFAEFITAQYGTDILTIDELAHKILVIVDDNGDYLGFMIKDTLERLCQIRILEQRNLEVIQSLKDLKEEYDSVIDASFDGIQIIDGRGVTLRVNEACEQMQAIKKEEVIGRHVEDLVEWGFYSDSAAAKVLKIKKTANILQVGRNGKQILLTATPVFKNNELKRIIVNCRDIDELIELKNQLQEERDNKKKVEYELNLLRQEHMKLEGIVTQSPEMHKVADLAVRVAPVDTTVLIQGESGVGKEVIAKLVYSKSTRNEESFIKIDCSAIPETLLESELFGYERGAFTGANKEGKIGLVELAHEGTLFLDEIGDMPLNLQAKLLRLLQDREFLRIGGKKPVKVDIRIIAATNKNLAKLVQESKFRDDLYYRLNVVPIIIPPLRQRKGDIQPLIMFFLSKYNDRYGLNKTIRPEVIKYMIDYEWPGNVRELENMTERLVVTSQGMEICLDDLPGSITEGTPVLKSSSADVFYSSFKNVMDQYERNLLQGIMQSVESVAEAAELLQLDVSTVRRKLKKHGIKVEL